MFNKSLEFVNSTIVERLFNRHTKKGLSQLIVGLTLAYTGFSEAFIVEMINYKWSFLDDFIKDYKIYIIILSLILLLFAGFNIFRKEYSRIRMVNLENKVKEKNLELQLKKIEKELKDYEV